ncbi:SURF1 family cytochrome oxidase biogenesis protein [Glaciihabitans sp. GrIS 2.15]|uniref:SURF1 family cytochrome oxidase biogenesis protein n=1 Tax=Glaciihabitans sp. GrIS 2.15 TaxID=3071710 RepID=UPI002DFD85D6|nr:cytochrome oxidase assembly protein ShyY1 [Glaciihabitans sp. GrIS 2.15]
MNRWSFALSRRWFGYLALALVFAAVCVALSQWQVARLHETRSANELVDRNYHSTPVAVMSVLPTLTSYSPKQRWMQVELTGSYLADAQMLVRNRPLNGQPGFEVLNPLLLSDGNVFLVDRGYVPIGNTQDRPDHIPSPPAGTVTVIARLQAGEPTLAGRSDTPGELATIHLPDVATLVGKPTYTGAYGLMVSESPAADTRPTAKPQPQLDEGLHISYAIQWVIFGIMAFFGLWYAIRQEYRMRNADDPDEQERVEVRERKKLTKPRSDSEVEDEILETIPHR